MFAEITWPLILYYKRFFFPMVRECFLSSKAYYSVNFLSDTLSSQVICDCLENWFVNFFCTSFFFFWLLSETGDKTRCTSFLIYCGYPYISDWRRYSFCPRLTVSEVTKQKSLIVLKNSPLGTLKHIVEEPYRSAQFLVLTYELMKTL